MSLIPPMSAEEVRTNVEIMCNKMQGWGWSVAALGKAYHATIYYETVEFNGGFHKYIWMPKSSQRCVSYFDALTFLLNSLYAIQQEIENLQKIGSGEGVEKGN